jgi:L-threonylcarbamoyladenylate synthase
MISQFPPTPQELARAVEILRAGEVVGLPTETVYGLAGDALNPLAAARIFAVKERPSFDPLIVHTATEEEAWLLASEVPELARKLAEKFWPGPLTLVLPKRSHVPDLVTSGLPQLALRVPSHPVAQALLRAFGGPLAAPSANRFGRISPTTAQAVVSELGTQVPLILNGGPCAVGVESTILKLESGRPPGLLRAGGVPLEEIEALIGPVEDRTQSRSNPEAPGQLPHHYAPRKSLRLVSAAEAGAWKERVGVGLLAFGPVDSAGWSALRQLSEKGDVVEAAAHFFQALRELDEALKVETLLAVALPQAGLGRAVNERLDRASARY